ncbi:hypothetical protein CWE12_03395 [Aliidiomarina sedimenti]|uniref:YqcC-like domain-containing protein n=1 Tax=Aliidiomarina sedimenti TaxID=1933879 RepID=A0ABY0C2Q8_9GAMM|nr:hypothetical protein CWE12_03395 [Aliidiomarina sedimenti]
MFCQFNAVSKRTLVQYQQVQILLVQLQNELRDLQLWQSQAPSAEALQSTQPFAVDTLAFHQWLQFIMIPRMENLVQARRPLPTSMAVSPMAVQVYSGQLKRHRMLINCLRELDQAVTGQDPLQPDQA